MAVVERGAHTADWPMPSSVLGTRSHQTEMSRPTISAYPAIAIALSTSPCMATVRASVRSMRNPTGRASAADMSADGINRTPLSVGLKPRTSWR